MGSVDLPRRFGKYVLLERLATGGMAEVFLAKVTRVESFERLLAIKCIRPELTEEPELVSMFIDEANLAGQLHHPNIVEILELGRYHEQLYIAMELVEGWDLRAIGERAAARGMRLPVGFAAYVVTEAAHGLDHAHRKKARDGTALHIVHRDISPPNILVTHQGGVKIADFGIAKAAGRVTQTRAGVLKGKFSYMAPEQITKGSADHRADIFALGAVLYELVALRRLFDGQGDFQIMEAVKNARIPDLRRHLPDAPAELIEVLETALKRDPDDRYPWASDMSKALEPLLIEDRKVFQARSAARFLRALFSEDEVTQTRRALHSVVDVEPLLEPYDETEVRESTQTFHSTFAVPAAALAAARAMLREGHAAPQGLDDEPTIQDGPTLEGEHTVPAARTLWDEHTKREHTVPAGGPHAWDDHTVPSAPGVQAERATEPDIDLSADLSAESDVLSNLELPAGSSDMLQPQTLGDELSVRPTPVEREHTAIRPAYVRLPSGRDHLVIGSVVAVVVVSLALFLWRRPDPTAASPRPPAPEAAAVVLDGGKETEEATPRPDPRRTETTNKTGYLSIEVPGVRSVTVFIDGKPAGRGPKTMQLPAGSYTVRVERPGGESRSAQVTVSPRHTKKKPQVISLRF